MVGEREIDQTGPQLGVLRSERRKAELSWVWWGGGAWLKVCNEKRQPMFGGLVLLQASGKR